MPVLLNASASRHFASRGVLIETRERRYALQMRVRFLPLMVLLCSLLSIGCASSETDETGTGGGNDGGAGATGGTSRTGGAAASGGTAGSSGNPDGICGAQESCTPGNTSCHAFCIDLCGGLENTDAAFCGVDDACACVCFEDDCDRTGCTLIECTRSPTADDFCDDQGVELCGGAPRDALCLRNGAAETGFCDIVCDSGTETCTPDP